MRGWWDGGGGWWEDGWEGGWEGGGKINGRVVGGMVVASGLLLSCNGDLRDRLGASSMKP